MQALALPFTARFIVLTLCIVATAACVGIATAQSAWLVPLSVPILLFGGLSLLGIRDLFQTRHAVLRNYPISAHLRFLLEEPSGRRCGNTSSRARRTACRSAATSAR